MNDISDICNNPISELPEDVLPRNMHVLQRLFFFTKNKKYTVVDASKIVIKEVIQVWSKIPVELKRIDYCNKMLQNLHASFREVQKDPSESRPKSKNFLKDSSNVFDISQDTSINLLGSIDNAAKQLFLSQSIEDIRRKILIIKQGNTPELTSSDDVNELLDKSQSLSLSESECKTDDLLSQNEIINTDQDICENIATASHPSDNEEFATDIAEKTHAKSQGTMIIEESPSSEETYTQSSGTSNYSVRGRSYQSKGIRGTINVMTPGVVASFDKAGVSDRDAMFIVSNIAHALGVDVNTLIISKSAIRNARMQVRKKEYERMKELFKDTSVSYLIVHWDGKLMPDNMESKKIDRLPILISTESFTKIIDVPALDNSLAKTMALAVYAALKDWGLSDLTVGLCCDTTNANLGNKGGAALLLEQLLNKNLLWLSCRHHILEIILAAAFVAKIPGTSGPNVTIFKRFQTEWDSIDENNYKNGLDDLEPELKEEIPRVVQFINTFLNEQLPRSDYKELLLLSLAFLGEAENFKFKRPGACHHARWMAKAIYSLKIYLLRESFKLSKQNVQHFYSICKFIVFVYLEPWYRSPLAIGAPNNDLKLLRSLKKYENIDKSISTATLKKFINHLWYFTPELTVLSLFDDEVEISVKQEIVKSFDSKIMDLEEEIPKKCDPLKIDLNTLDNLQLDYFTNSQSMNFFTRFNIDSGFLEYDCSEWKTHQSYINSREKLKHLLVVNDVSERAVKLTEEYINSRSKDEDQKQYLIQFLDEYKKNYLCNTNKKEMIKKLKTMNNS